jgi:hypothetical protein
MQQNIFNKMHFIAYGRLRNAFTMWKEELDHYRKIGEGKRARVIDRLIKATMSHEQQAFLLWKDWIKNEHRKEQLMKMVISLMLKTANLMEYNLFTKWKLATFTDKEKRNQLRRARILNSAVECLERRLRNHLRAGVTAIAKDSWNTNMQVRILNKLTYVAHGRMKGMFDRWKFTVHSKMHAEQERKKARVLDMLVQHSMSDTHRALLRWAKNMRNQKMLEYG